VQNKHKRAKIIFFLIFSIPVGDALSMLLLNRNRLARNRRHHKGISAAFKIKFEIAF
jgi:hypothetical protein